MMHQGAVAICIVGRGNPGAKVMVVGKMPDSGKFRAEIEGHLSEVGLSTKNIYYTSAVKCRNFDRDPSNTDVKKCKTYLDQEIEMVKPKFILALGNEALLATAGKSGITKYRGKIFKHPSGARIIPTISPSAVKRNPGQLGGFMADLRFFAAEVEGKEIGIPPPKIVVVDSLDKVKALNRALKRSDEVAYDVETTGDGEWALDAAIVTLSITVHTSLEHGQDDLRTYVIPLFHPESPLRKVWELIVRAVVSRLRKVPKRIAHNGKYDDKWLWKFSGLEIHQTFDTLIAAHMLDENRPKGLKPLAQTLLGVRPWGIDTKDLLNTPLKTIIKYNAKDTHHTYHLKQLFAPQLDERPRIKRLFTAIMMPSNAVYTKSEMDGIWVDREMLQTNTKIAYDMLHEVERRLMEHVPDPLDPWQDPPWPTMGKKGKPAEINFNASKWCRWWLFECLGLPVSERGKEKADGSPGDPSMREGVLMELKDKHPAVQIMLDRVEWQKITSSFLTPYADLMDENDRIHTVFKPWGTVTGRTSSGKEDQEKITAQKGKRRGANLQQVPRNIIVRGVFGAPHPDYFVEFDYSQIELRLAAFIARERHMLSLYRQGADIHRTTAARVLNKPESQVTGEERKKVGKSNNFGFLYGMSWRKFIQTAMEKYGHEVDEWEAKAQREAYFELFPDLLAWHGRQRAFVKKHGYAISPLGRVRNLPDIYSPEKSVRGEAERQAINSPVQGMGSDMLQLAMVLVDKRIRKAKIPALILGTVHDALNLQVAPEAMSDLLPMVRDVMENLPLERLFDVNMDIPILADCKVGRHWGGAQELTSAQVDDWNPNYVEVA